MLWLNRFSHSQRARTQIILSARCSQPAEDVTTCTLLWWLSNSLFLYNLPLRKDIPLPRTIKLNKPVLWTVQKHNKVFSCFSLCPVTDLLYPEDFWFFFFFFISVLVSTNYFTWLWNIVHQLLAVCLLSVSKEQQQCCWELWKGPEAKTDSQTKTLSCKLLKLQSRHASQLDCDFKQLLDTDCAPCCHMMALNSTVMLWLQSPCTFSFFVLPNMRCSLIGQESCNYQT